MDGYKRRARKGIGVVVASTAPGLGGIDRLLHVSWEGFLQRALSARADSDA